MSAVPIAAPAVRDRGARACPPVMAAGVELIGALQGSGHRDAPGLVRRADGQTIALTPLLYAVLAAIDGRRGAVTIAERVRREVGCELDANDVRYLVDHKLRPLGLVQEVDGTEPTTRPANPLLALRWKVVVTDPVWTDRLTRPFAALFHPAVVGAVLLAFLASVVWLVAVHGLAGPTRATFTDPRMVLLVVALTVVSTGFHEFGHAAACRYGGARPGVMGAGLYLVWPAFYTDVTDSYRLSRRGRLRVDLGGLYFNAVFAVAVVAAWWWLRWDALLLVVATQVLQMLRQLVPIVRFDGYHILADLTGVPDLFAHVGPTLRRVLPSGRRAPSPLRPWVAWVVTLWVGLVVPILAVVFGGLVYALPRIAATAWEGILAQRALLVDHWAAGEVAAAAVRALSVVTLALPVAGAVYLVLRVGRRVVRRLWRATEDRRWRGAAALAVLAGLIGLVAAWWPQGQYTPVEAAGGRQIPAPGPPAPPEPPRGEPLLAAAGRGPELATGVEEEPSPPPEPVAAQQVASEPAPRPTVERTASAPAPAAAPVTASAPRPEWPFSWPRPPEPGSEDNRAWAVNTRDGKVVTDVSIDDAWFRGGAPVTLRNEAWALAQCVDCRTVAVAFQAVFVVGSSDVVTPINTSVAANERCEACRTLGIAHQLVVTLTAEPTPATLAELEAVLAQLEGLRGEVRTATAAEIHATLQHAEDRIVGILEGGGLLPAPPDPDADTADAADPAALPEPEPIPVADAEPTDDTTTPPVDEPPVEEDGVDGSTAATSDATVSDEALTGDAAGSEEPLPDTGGDQPAADDGSGDAVDGADGTTEATLSDDGMAEATQTDDGTTDADEQVTTDGTATEPVTGEVTTEG